MPKLIRCPLRQECVIPYSVTNTDRFLFHLFIQHACSANQIPSETVLDILFTLFGSSCGFHLSWTGAKFSSVHLTNSVILESSDCGGKATIIHNVSGIDEFCLSLESSDG